MLQVCLRCFLEQTTHISTNLFAFRNRFSQYLLLTILGFASIEIDVAYKSKLSSIIMRPPYFELDNLNDLLNANYDITVESLKNDTVWAILNATDPIVGKARE